MMINQNNIIQEIREIGDTSKIVLYFFQEVKHSYKDLTNPIIKYETIEQNDNITHLLIINDVTVGIIIERKTKLNNIEFTKIKL